ncbi:MAG: hypothetical protein ACOX65_13455 [Anaerotruncus rubiinfantis]|jgi:hypothetical protein
MGFAQFLIDRNWRAAQKVVCRLTGDDGWLARPLSQENVEEAVQLLAPMVETRHMSNEERKVLSMLVMWRGTDVSRTRDESTRE